MKKIFYKLIIVFLVVQVGYFAYSFLFDRDNEIISSENEQVVEEIIIPEKTDRIESIEITEGSTYGSLMEEMDIGGSVYMSIYAAAEDVYDLVKIRLGRELTLVYDKDTDEFKELIYQIDTEEKIHVRNSKYFEKENEEIATSSEEVSNYWFAEIIEIPYEIKVTTKEGEVKTSMYVAALENDIDERAIIELANAFQWSIDFALDPRVGDTFKFVYEERYLDGEYVMPGRILAGRYINAGEENNLYYFEESEDNMGYFDSEGNSVQKMFLRAPVEFRYVSSGFTTGSRYVAAFNVSTGHRAIDYATPLGTPIRAVGDGTVIFAGWNSGGYGNLTKIRHNSTYQTNYAHQSRFAVSYGQKVKQGDIIGYVGSTGFSTGPHLHYEMVKNGVKVNPYNEILPPGEPIKEDNRARFEETLEEYNKMLE
ncbi:hypothetical protein C0584_04990 [Candidatus Parcubacteria bacterium]|nr:MAG: hypothetical protein C0584_04990 [Candidatus Parcubacteria bacterium]